MRRTKAQRLLVLSLPVLALVVAGCGPSFPSDQDLADMRWRMEVCHPSYIGACLWKNADRYVCVGHPDAGKVPTVLHKVAISGPDEFNLSSKPGGSIGCPHLPFVENTIP